MLHIKMIPHQPAIDPDDPISRGWYGYKESASDIENLGANHGYYTLGKDADYERYVLFSYTGDGLVKFAATINRIEPAPGKPGKRIIEVGELLGEGHAVYDRWVNKPMPEKAARSRNPVAYITDDVPGLPDAGSDCLCGCGQRVYRAKFVPGHDQVALHQCVSQIGSIADFVEWFGAQMNGGSDAERATVIRGEGTIDLTVRPDGRVELRWMPKG
jgi:hypothetical protein